MADEHAVAGGFMVTLESRGSERLNPLVGLGDEGLLGEDLLHQDAVDLGVGIKPDQSAFCFGDKAAAS